MLSLRQYVYLIPKGKDIAVLSDHNVQRSIPVYDTREGSTFSMSVKCDTCGKVYPRPDLMPERSEDNVDGRLYSAVYGCCGNELWYDEDDAWHDFHGISMAYTHNARLLLVKTDTLKASVNGADTFVKVVRWEEMYDRVLLSLPDEATTYAYEYQRDIVDEALEKQVALYNSLQVALDLNEEVYLFPIHAEGEHLKVRTWCRNNKLCLRSVIDTRRTYEISRDGTRYIRNAILVAKSLPCQRKIRTHGNTEIPSVIPQPVKWSEIAPFILLHRDI